MAASHQTASDESSKWYWGKHVPKIAIDRFAAQVVERFHPEKIILFGSHAYGTPHAESDVDVLVVMPTRNQLDQAAKISLAIDPPFALDIIVRTPRNMKWRLAEGDSFLREIVTKGTVLYEAPDGGMASKGSGRSSRGRKPRAVKPAAP